MTDTTYDVTVIGTGPGGYVCAIKAAQLGLKVAVVEKRATHGGTCLNIGCIPSKALLHASEMFNEAGHTLKQLGVDVGKPKLDLRAMMKHKDATVKSNVEGIAYLFKKNGVTDYHGAGRVLAKEGDAHRVEVTKDDGSTETIRTRNVVIATGSDVAGIPGVEVEFDEERIVSSTGALDLAEVPGRIVVVGGGVIGLELGSVWRRLGAEVTVVEFLDEILGGMDKEVASQFRRMLLKQGIQMKLGRKVTDVTRDGDVVRVTHEPAKPGEKGGDAETDEADVVLVATGRRPFTDGLGLEEAGVETVRGRVTIDKHWQTTAPGIYAIGDVVDGPMLAHKAEDEGMAVAEQLAGRAGHVNYEVIPSVVYTEPEVASVGRTEEELKADGVGYRVGKFPLSANGRARAMLSTGGFVKVLARESDDKVLGVHIVAKGAGDLIHEAAVLMEFGGSAEDLGRVCHAHPTMSEAVREAGLAAFEKPIHV